MTRGCVPVMWIVTNNAANLERYPDAASIGVYPPDDLVSLAECEWRGWGTVRILVTTRVPGPVTGEHDFYRDTITPQEAAAVEAALEALVS